MNPATHTPRNRGHASGAVYFKAPCDYASAPDLLEALKAAAAAFDYTVAALAKGQTVSMGSLQNCAASARQAIARAEGRT